MFDQMNKYPNNQAIQLYGLFQFAITYVPITDEGMLHLDALIIYNHALGIISASNSQYNYKFKVFALNVLYNILSTHAGRMEFFNVRHVTLQGEGRQDAIERHQLLMLKKFLRYLERIPTVVEKTSTKGSLDFTDVHVPSKEGVDLVEGVLLVSKEGVSSYFVVSCIYIV